MNYQTSRQRAALLRDRLWIQRLIWVYFFLLVFEGALRKWLLPSLANPLLLVRDPVVVVAYFLAWRSGWFPRNTFITAAAAIALLSVCIGFATPGNSPFVTVYGFRCNFLQLPFIFVIARAFDESDVARIGRWVLMLALGMAPLMILQFLAPPSSFINAGADGNFDQITSALGRIRPPGTFSFIAGPVFFFSLVVAFLLSNSFRARYPLWLMWGAAVATLAALAVSGSRSALGSIVLVFVFALFCCSFLRPQLALKWVGSAVVVGVVAFLMTNIDALQLGVQVFAQRISNASGAEGGAAGVLERVAGGYVSFYPTLFDAPLLGHGLGVGTNVGAVLMSGKAQFLLAEDEWSRVILEIGPILGLLFVLYRIAIVVWIGRVAWRTAARRDPLSLLLFGCFFNSMLIGNLGQPTILGFTILTAGLCLAAARTHTSTASTPTVATQSAPAIDASAERPLTSAAS